MKRAFICVQSKFRQVAGRISAGYPPDRAGSVQSGHGLFKGECILRFKPTQPKKLWPLMDQEKIFLSISGHSFLLILPTYPFSIQSIRYAYRRICSRRRRSTRIMTSSAYPSFNILSSSCTTFTPKRKWI